MFRTALVSLAGLALMATAQPNLASAQTADSGSAQVAYRDLDLSSDKGVARLYLRLEHGAQAVCVGILTPADIEAPQRYAACVADAMSRAVASVGSQKLTELYARRSGGPAAPIETADAR